MIFCLILLIAGIVVIGCSFIYGVIETDMMDAVLPFVIGLLLVGGGVALFVLNGMNVIHF